MKVITKNFLSMEFLENECPNFHKEVLGIQNRHPHYIYASPYQEFWVKIFEKIVLIYTQIYSQWCHLLEDTIK